MLKEKDRWAIQLLHRAGNSIRQISKVTRHNRNTIGNVLASLSFGAPDAGSSGGQTATQKRSGRRSMLEPLKEVLLGKIREGASRAELLLDLRRGGLHRVEADIRSVPSCQQRQNLYDGRASEELDALGSAGDQKQFAD